MRFLRGVLGMVGLAVALSACGDDHIIEMQKPAHSNSAVYHFTVDKKNYLVELVFPEDAPTGERILLSARRTEDARLSSIALPGTSPYIVSSVNWLTKYHVVMTIKNDPTVLTPYSGVSENSFRPKNEPAVGAMDIGLGKVCNGSLIGRDLVLTAAHCIEKSGSCRETKITFYSEEKGKKSYSCEKILFYDRIADQAVMKIVTRSGRPTAGDLYGVLPIETEPYIYSTGFAVQVQSQRDSLRRTEVCSVIESEKTIRLDREATPASFTMNPLSYHSTCHVRKGDSGSPMFNGAGKVVGALITATGDATQDSVSSWWSSLKPEVVQLVSLKSDATVARLSQL